MPAINLDRNALRSDSLLRSEFHSFKMELDARFPHDKSSCAAAKAPFIRSAITRQAVERGFAQSQCARLPHPLM